MGEEGIAVADVIIVGSGPTGMMLAGELALAGIDVAVMERRATSELVGSRAGGFHSRTIEILDQRGIADRFIAEGQIAQTARFGTSVLDIGDFPTRHPYGLALWQNRIEPILADWIERLGVRVEHSREVTGFVQDESGVDVAFHDGETMRAKYLVGADGGRSVIRKAAGIEFRGWAATRSNLIAEVEVTQDPPAGLVQDETGIHALHLMPDGHTYRVVTTEPQVGPTIEPTLSDLSSALTSVYGTDFGVHNPTSLSRFTDATRQATAYRSERVLLSDSCTRPARRSRGMGRSRNRRNTHRGAHALVWAGIPVRGRTLTDPLTRRTGRAGRGGTVRRRLPSGRGGGEAKVSVSSRERDVAPR
jgi:3-(3-hydroxy-phenyl)propionate hydroxylase